MKPALSAIVIVLTSAVTAAALADAPPEAPAVTEAHAASEAVAAAPATPVTKVGAPALVAKVAAVSAPTKPVMALSADQSAAKEALAPKETGSSAPAAASAAAPPAIVSSPPAPVAAPAASPEPLPLRASKQVTLASEPAPTPWIYKLAFVVLLGAAGFVAWRKGRSTAKGSSAHAPLRVVGRTAMGSRGELAVIEVGGMRLLVGVTSSSMQTLAILEDDAAAQEAVAPEPQEVTRTEGPGRRTTTASEIGARARALFGGIDLGPPPLPPAPARPNARAVLAASRYADERDVESVRDPSPQPKSRGQERRRRATRDVEGQVRGLSLALGAKR